MGFVVDLMEGHTASIIKAELKSHDDGGGVFLRNVSNTTYSKNEPTLNSEASISNESPRKQNQLKHFLP
jgi:hypothetical protein